MIFKKFWVRCCCSVKNSDWIDCNNNASLLRAEISERGMSKLNSGSLKVNQTKDGKINLGYT